MSRSDDEPKRMIRVWINLPLGAAREMVTHPFEACGAENRLMATTTLRMIRGAISAALQEDRAKRRSA